MFGLGQCRLFRNESLGASIISYALEMLVKFSTDSVKMPKSKDPFRRHFERLLTESEADRLLENASVRKSIKYPSLGDAAFTKPSIDSDSATENVGAQEFQLGAFRPNIRRVIESKRDLSPLQQDLISILTNYQDIFYADFQSCTSRKRSEDMTWTYAAHALNHVIKTRWRILKNNSKLRQRTVGDRKKSIGGDDNKLAGDEDGESINDDRGGSIDGDGGSDDSEEDRSVTDQKKSISTNQKRSAPDNDGDTKQILKDNIRGTKKARKNLLSADRDQSIKDPATSDHQKSNSDQTRSLDNDQEESFGDQGLTRPKVLILLPFRYMALNVVRSMIDLLFPDKSEKKKPIINKKRFFNEYEAEEEEEKDEKAVDVTGSASKRPRLERPLDFKETFHGNIDDCFRLGISLGKAGSMKLYAEFYQSDIILASPLGLRMAMGAEGEKEYDYDFLSSIEILIMDRADVFLMQNWSHVLYILQHLHRQPRQSHGIDFSRVRLWNLNGWSKFYRQTIVFSAVTTPEMRTVFNQYCRNFEGRVFVEPETKSGDVGSMARVIVALPHAFQRFPCDNLVTESEKRFDFFLQKVLPQYSDSSMAGTLIYIPSYYDFVRLRNYFKKNDNSLSFVQICEYTSAKKVSSARDLFFHGDKHFLLYTERFHFYHRYRIRGIKNLIFYQLPTYPHFYTEMCNAMLDDRPGLKVDKATLTCAVLYSQFDALRLAGVLGREKAGEVLKSEKNVHVLVTE